MEIDKIYSSERMKEERKIYDLWWQQKLNRPIAGFAVKCRTPDLPIPKVPLLSQENCNNLLIPVNDIVDAIEYEVCSYEYYGDAYPSFCLDCFGPGIVAAILGAELDNSTGRVWFHPKKIVEPDKLSLNFSEDNIWYKRISEIMKRATERFKGRIIFSMPDLSGIMDILAVFRPGEHLLYDLYDYEEEVKSLCAKIFDLWKTIFINFSKIMKSDEYGYTDWSSLLSTKPSYIIQSDFSYMISTEMFIEFIKPNLEKFCKWLPNTIYHMDGPGEIKHLQEILSIKELKAVQWVPGAGNPTCENYPEIYKEIEAAGKNIQIISDNLDKMITVSKQINKVENLSHPIFKCNISEKEENIACLKTLKIL